MPQTRDRSGIGLEDARDHAQERGLAGAVRAEQHVEQSARNAERNAIDRRFVETLAEVGDFESETRSGHVFLPVPWKRKPRLQGRACRNVNGFEGIFPACRRKSRLAQPGLGPDQFSERIEHAGRAAFAGCGRVEAIKERAEFGQLEFGAAIASVGELYRRQ